MSKTIFKLFLVAVIVAVAVVNFNNDTAGAPKVTLELLKAKGITNKDLPKVIELVAIQEGIDLEIFKKVLFCESSFRHFDGDQVLISRTKDSGVAQIHLPTWNNKAKELGLDLNDPIDNLLMSAWIIKEDSRGWRNYVCFNKLY